MQPRTTGFHSKFLELLHRTVAFSTFRGFIKIIIENRTLLPSVSESPRISKGANHSEKETIYLPVLTRIWRKKQSCFVVLEIKLCRKNLFKIWGKNIKIIAHPLWVVSWWWCCWWPSLRWSVVLLCLSVDLLRASQMPWHHWIKFYLNKHPILHLRPLLPVEAARRMTDWMQTNLWRSAISSHPPKCMWTNNVAILQIPGTGIF